jgi:MoaA/NifB/PqqE/SkfB family radical SAM enzyme
MLFNKRDINALPFTGSTNWQYSGSTIVAKKVSRNQSPHRMISGIQMKWIHIRLKLTLLKVLIKNYDSPLDWVKGLQYLVKLRRRFLGDHALKKMARVSGKYYMGLYTPGWNDIEYERFIASELHNFKETKSSKYRFNHVFLAITKKCALQCDHCYEWDSLNKKDVLTIETLHAIVKRVQDMGTAQIHFTGGEPMLKVDMVISMMEKAAAGTNFWMNTSGLKLTDANAYKLKEAGLTGVFISLDHFSPEEHNSFRNYKDAFYWAKEGAKNAFKNGLVVAYSICMRKEFVSVENVLEYMEMAKDAGVHFVQFLEPKAVGHYKNEDVTLNNEHIAILENIFLDMNFSNRYTSYPIISYHGYYQRRQGCFSAGKKGVYVDTDGDINPCTFCHRKSGNILDPEIDTLLATMATSGCPTF